MKKIIVSSILTITLLFSVNAFAQKKTNKFRGTIKQEIEISGKSPVEQIYKIYDDKIYAANEAGANLMSGNVHYMIINFTEIFNALKAGGVEVEGDGKMYLKDVFNIDSILKNDDIKVEYLSETKDILGYKAKKAIVKGVSEGEAYAMEAWYTEEIGPEYNGVIAPPIKGFPLEIIQTNAGGETIFKLSTKNIEKGKVKEAEFLLPVGYTEKTQEQFVEIIEIIQEALGGEE